MKPAKRRRIQAEAHASVQLPERMAMTSRYHRICQHCGTPTLLPAAHFLTCHGVYLLHAQAQRARAAEMARRPRSAVLTPQAEAALMRVKAGR